MSARQQRPERQTLTRHVDSKPVRLVASNDGEDVGEIILPAPKGGQPTRYRVS
ncbi:hypothetical protein GCM10009115_32230 [Sphingopyxis soli]|uniref:Uncharacterized protein n=1 Tax=Sphingopyxis soli TaxID=592051 RepID=A0ABP3XRP8_9SPHN|nr:hypothetical protein [Sphingopyxis soli]